MIQDNPRGKTGKLKLIGDSVHIFISIMESGVGLFQFLSEDFHFLSESLFVIILHYISPGLCFSEE
jgi:hypothetical protein